MMAGLPVSYGIVSSIVASIIGGLFSGSRFVIQGPTNATAALLLSALAASGIGSQDAVAHIPILLLLVGSFLILGSLLQVAQLVKYVSRSVLLGYISAAALWVISNQIHNALGFSIDIAGKSSTFLATCSATILNLHHTHIGAFTVMLLTLAVYWIARRWTSGGTAIALTLFIVAIGWYPICQLLPNATFLTHVATLKSFNWYYWNWTFPKIELSEFGTWMNEALALAFLAILEALSIGRSLATRAGERIQSNQVMFSLGLANLGCALFGGMTASGSLTRSTLNYRSGAKTSASAIISGIFGIIGILLLAPHLDLVPQPCLATLIIILGCSLFNKHAMRIVMTATLADACVFAATILFGLLFSLNTAIFVGVGLSIALFLRKAAMPELIEYAFTQQGNLLEISELRESPPPEISIVHIEGTLFFGASDLFQEQIRHICERPQLTVLILKMRNAHLMDATCILALEELVKSMKAKKRTLLISEVKPATIQILKNSGLAALIGIKNIFADNKKNPLLSTTKALQRAKDIIGGADPDIRIFVNLNATPLTCAENITATMPLSDRNSGGLHT